jgi:hypothetical protein
MISEEGIRKIKNLCRIRSGTTILIGCQIIGKKQRNLSYQFRALGGFGGYLFLNSMVSVAKNPIEKSPISCIISGYGESG